MTEIELTIDKLVAGGEGLGFVDGKAVFVPGVIPGERVRARMIQARKDFTRAALVEVLSASPDRRQGPCPLAGICGGCDWLHIAYARQRELKVSIFRETLRRVGRLEWGGLEIEAGPELGYRNRVQVHGDAGGNLGFMGMGTNRVVPVRACPVAAPVMEKVFREQGRAAGKGAERALPPRFTVFGQGGLLAVEGVDDGRELAVNLGGREIRFSVRCFFQSNIAMMERLIPYAVEWLMRESGTAADLYCGVGIFGALLAPGFEKTIAVESDGESLSFARRNIPGDGNEFHEKTVERWIDDGLSTGSLGAAVVDPPRTGLGRAVCDYLAVAPRRLAYVSCNPVTMARDLSWLLGHGLVLRDIRLFDFYPQTSHIEAVARLEREAA